MNNNFKKICLTGASLLIFTQASQVNADAPNAANEEKKFPGTFSGNVAFTSDYRFRGISQTLENPATQGGIEYNHPSGLKLGAWGSNIDFGTADGSLETDLYGSYTWKPDSSSSIEAGVYGYLYPGASSNLHNNYIEGYTALSYTIDKITLNGAFNYSPDNFASSGDAFFVRAGASVALPNDFAIDGGIGRQWVDDNAAFGYPDYTTWDVGLSYTWEGFTGKIQYVDTDISENRCAIGCDATGIISITKKF